MIPARPQFGFICFGDLLDLGDLLAFCVLLVICMMFCYSCVLWHVVGVVVYFDCFLMVVMFFICLFLLCATVTLLT